MRIGGLSMVTPLEQWNQKRNTAVEKINRTKYDADYCILVGSATCENAAGATKIYEEFKKQIGDSTNVYLGIVGCTGRCSMEPIVQIVKKRELSVKYARVKIEDVSKIMENHIRNGNIVNELLLQEN